MFANRCRLVGFTATVLALCGSFQAGAQGQDTLDATAKKLLGNYTYKIELMVATCDISYEDGKWTVGGVFKDKGRNVGAFEGIDVVYQGGALKFKQKYLTKPREKWLDEQPMTIKFAGAKVVCMTDKKGDPIRVLERVSDPNSVVKNKEGQTDLRKLIGNWVGKTSDNRYGTILNVSFAKDKWSVTETFVGSKNKIAGQGVGTEIEVKDGKLSWRLKYLKRPSGFITESPVHAIDSLTDNTVTLYRREGKRWVTLYSFAKLRK